MFSTLNMKNFIIAGHEHSTRDSRGQRLISINPVVTEQNHREPPYYGKTFTLFSNTIASWSLIPKRSDLCHINTTRTHPTFELFKN